MRIFFLFYEFINRLYLRVEHSPKRLSNLWLFSVSLEPRLLSVISLNVFDIEKICDRQSFIWWHILTVYFVPFYHHSTLSCLFLLYISCNRIKWLISLFIWLITLCIFLVTLWVWCIFLDLLQVGNAGFPDRTIHIVKMMMSGSLNISKMFYTISRCTSQSSSLSAATRSFNNSTILRNFRNNYSFANFQQSNMWSWEN